MVLLCESEMRGNKVCAIPNGETLFPVAHIITELIPVVRCGKMLMWEGTACPQIRRGERRASMRGVGQTENTQNLKISS